LHQQKKQKGMWPVGRIPFLSLVIADQKMLSAKM
jgi:hypothetical protein